MQLKMKVYFPSDPGPRATSGSRKIRFRHTVPILPRRILVRVVIYSHCIGSKAALFA